MYDKNKTLIDRRELLRVKLKSLAVEARIIRREEQRTFGALREELHRHRVLDVRKAARDTHVAYALIRGKTIDDIEPNRTSEPDWAAVEKMVKKYGPKQVPTLAKAA